MVVTVRDGQVESRRYADSGAPVAAEWAEAYPDVEGLFAVVEDALRRSAAYVAATYDSQRGLPNRINIDYQANWADDELGYLVHEFRPR